ncbi:hypothetical protein ILUMI_15804, partial [Ignelater luminosus]
QFPCHSSPKANFFGKRSNVPRRESRNFEFLLHGRFVNGQRQDRRAKDTKGRFTTAVESVRVRIEAMDVQRAEHKETNWPVAPSLGNVDAPEAAKITLVHVNTAEFGNDIVNRFSSYSRLQRVLGYVVRFIKNLSSKESHSSGPLTNSEMNEATVLLIKMVQAVEFAEDILTLKSNGSVARSTSFVRVIDNANLTYENFYTILTQIESVLNSRPLCPLTQDPNDLEPLTPGHFLIGSPLTSYPQVVESPTSSANLSAFRHRQLLINHFWNRWSKEYINNLQQRSKWKVRGQQTLHAGQLVIVKEDNVPPLVLEDGANRSGLSWC